MKLRAAVEVVPRGTPPLLVSYGGILGKPSPEGSPWRYEDTSTDAMAKVFPLSRTAKHPVCH